MRSLLILIGLIAAINLNAQGGFTTYQNEYTAPTTQEIIQSMTAAQRSGVLNSYGFKSKTEVKYLYGISTPVISYFFRYFKMINTSTDQLVVAYDLSETQVLDSIQSRYGDEFTRTQLNSVLQRKYQVYKPDNNGDYDWYKTKMNE